MYKNEGLVKKKILESSNLHIKTGAIFCSARPHRLNSLIVSPIDYVTFKLFSFTIFQSTVSHVKFSFGLPIRKDPVTYRWPCTDNHSTGESRYHSLAIDLQVGSGSDRIFTGLNRQPEQMWYRPMNCKIDEEYSIACSGELIKCKWHLRI